MEISVSPAAFADYRLSVPIETDSHGHYLMTAGDLIRLNAKVESSTHGEFGIVRVATNDGCQDCGLNVNPAWLENASYQEFEQQKRR